MAQAKISSIRRSDQSTSTVGKNLWLERRIQWLRDIENIFSSMIEKEFRIEEQKKEIRNFVMEQSKLIQKDLFPFEYLKDTLLNQIVPIELPEKTNPSISFIQSSSVFLCPILLMLEN